MDVTADLLSVGARQILAGLVFPAHRWQVIAQAQYYGAGADFLLALDRLPTRSYSNIGEVLSQLAGGSRPVRPPGPLQRPVTVADRAKRTHPMPRPALTRGPVPVPVG
jgi:Protein of unknown function (DUF2795)